MRRALVLSGGGARGAYQVGMLEQLVGKAGLDFQIIRGVSVGALNASFLAQASTKDDSRANLTEKVDELKKIWTKKITGNHSVYKKRLGEIGLALGADSLYSFSPLKEIIRDNLSLDQIKQSGRNFAVGTVSITSGRYSEWSPLEPNFIDKLVASASIPVVFPMVNIKPEKNILVDGGLRNITPLMNILREEPDEIYVLLTSRLIREGNRLPDSGVDVYKYEQWEDNLIGTRITGLDVLERTLDILTDEIYLQDLREFLKWNQVNSAMNALKQMIQEGVSITKRLSSSVEEVHAILKKMNRRTVPIYMLAPREWFDEEQEPGKRNPTTDFSPRLIHRAIAHGKEIAAAPELWLWPPV